MSKISPRILTALVGIPLVLGLVWWGGAPFKLFVLALALVGLRELQNAMGRSEDYRGTKLMGAVAYVSVFCAVWWGISALWAASTLAILFIVSVLFYDTTARFSLASISVTLLATVYVALFALLPPLRENGNWLWLMLGCVWANDTAAYYVGRAIGKHKLISLSPGKTREGALGGIFFSVIVGAGLGVLLHIPIAQGLGLGLILGFATIFGDLAESFWKRELGVKDLGTLLPGHGGVLDRCDSILFAALATTIWLMNR